MTEVVDDKCDRWMTFKDNQYALLSLINHTDNMLCQSCQSTLWAHRQLVLHLLVDRLAATGCKYFIVSRMTG